MNLMSPYNIGIIIALLLLIALIHIFLQRVLHVRIRLMFSFALFVVFILLIRTSVFIVNEGSQAVITQFGAIMGQPYTKAGLYFKVPFIWKVNYFDKRIFRQAIYGTRIPTKDGYFISLDEIFNWRIADPALFIQTMPSIEAARGLIANNISGGIRQAVSANDLLSIIRTLNKTSPISTFLEYLSHELPSENLEMSESSIEQQLLGMSIAIEDGRYEIMGKIRTAAVEYLATFGIEIVGVLILNVSYDHTVEKEIFARMIAERLREAARLTASGNAEALRIHGEVQKKYQSIIAPAQKHALLIKGEAEAKALKIQALAYGKDSNFYNYWRTLRIYEETLPKMSHGIILSTDSPILKWIQESNSIFNYTAVNNNESKRE